ncbi:folylpolyglutamate synthase/dihydrofolate synthase family protein [Cytophagaceae bacterium ABcell3]|nr:folylpolyglutamate synthase/dihydrofolate synthase family protein [Cytophagaceae bacterium ABcell3]
MFRNAGAGAIKPGLHNTEALCKHLGNPEKKIKTIHVAGTNGKGSSSHMLAAILQSAGYKTGLFTSPHLKSFTERFRINGEEMPEEYVVEFVAKHKDFFEALELSFFEMNVGMAFAYFAEHQTDIAIIETGLGGRLDSTNVITPELSLITNIGYDHQNILGDTLDLIATEKAGIIKSGAPVVVSQTQQDIKHVFESKAAEQQAKLFFADDVYNVSSHERTVRNLKVNVLRDGKEYLTGLTCSLNGLYQTKNIPGVLMAVEVLNQRGFKIDEAHIVKGLCDVVRLTGLKGRWQVLSEKPLVICDTGHNEDGIKNIVAQLQLSCKDKLICILGLMADKDTDKILSLFPNHAYYYFCNAHTPRAMDAETLALKALPHGLIGEVVSDVNKALAAAKERVGEDDLIFIGGSTFLVAELDNL